MYFSHVCFSHSTLHLNKSHSQHLENVPHAYLYWILFLPHLKKSSFYGGQMFFSLMPFYSHVLALFNNSSVHLGILERVIVLQIRSEPCDGSELVCHSAAGHSSGQVSFWWPFTYVFLKQYLGSFAKGLFYRLGIFSPWINEQAQVRATQNRQRAGPEAEDRKFALGEAWYEGFLIHKASCNHLYSLLFSLELWILLFLWIMGFHIETIQSISQRNERKAFCWKEVLEFELQNFGKYERVGELFVL